MYFMFVTFDTSQLLMSLLNVDLLLNKPNISVTLLTSHVLMSPYVTVAAASSATHAFTAVCNSALSAGVNTGVVSSTSVTSMLSVLSTLPASFVAVTITV